MTTKDYRMAFEELARFRRSYLGDSAWLHEYKQVFAPCFTATRISLIVQATKPPVNPDLPATLGAHGSDDDIDKTFSLSALKFMGHDDARR